MDEFLFSQDFRDLLNPVGEEREDANMRDFIASPEFRHLLQHDEDSTYDESQLNYSNYPDNIQDLHHYSGDPNEIRDLLNQVVKETETYDLNDM